MMASPAPPSAAVAAAPPEAARRVSRARVRRLGEGRVLLSLAHADPWLGPGERAVACALEAVALRPLPGERTLDWLAEAIAAAEAALRREQGALPEGEVLATSLALALVGPGQVHVAWVGDASALLTRRGAVCAATSPHDLPRLLRERGERPPGPHVDGLLTRSLTGLVEAPAAEPELTSWQVEPGDRLLLVPGPVLRGLRDTSTRVRWGLPLHTVADLLARLGARDDRDAAVVLAELPEA